MKNISRPQLERVCTIVNLLKTNTFTVLADDYVVLNAETWAQVAKCMDRRETMRVTYQKFNGEVKSYTLRPIHLVYHHGNWYVLACSDSGKRALTFALSRFRKIEGTRIHFDIPAGFDLMQHLGESFGVVRGEKVFQVRLLFNRQVATYIRERVWHPSQTLKERRNGDLELQFETAGWKELVRWVLSWQPDVNVLSPKRLRERIEMKLRQSLEHFPA